MSIFGSRSKEKQFYTIFDVSSGSVAVAVVVSKKHSVELLWSKRLEFGYQGYDDYNRYVRTMYATLLEVGMRLTSEGLKKVRELDPDFSPRRMRVCCIFAQPWFIGSVHTETISKEKPFVVTSSVLQTLREQGIRDASQKQETLSWQDVMGEFEPLEVVQNKVLIEGYPVRQYEHRTVRELSVQWYIALVSSSVWEHVKEVIQRVLPNHEATFFSSTHLLTTSEVLLPENKAKRSILLEVTGEITSICLKKDNTIRGVITIPYGKDHVLKVLAPDAVSAEEARGSLEVFLKKNMKDMVYDSFPSELQEALSVWHQEVQRGMCELAEGVTPPLLVDLMVDAQWYSIYKLALERSWEMPGVRQLQTNKVRNVGFVGVSGDIAQGQKDDTRLYALIQSLRNYTHEKSVCYNNLHKI